jgi:predicted signal transduction protein with EAL and GGDEF domain
MRMPLFKNFAQHLDTAHRQLSRLLSVVWYDLSWRFAPPGTFRQRFEQAIVNMQSASASEAVATAHRVTVSLSGKYELDQYGEANVGVSIGIACAPNTTRFSGSSAVICCRGIFWPVRCPPRACVG